MNPSLELRRKLEGVASRFRSLWLWRILAAGWVVLAAVGVALLQVPNFFDSYDSAVLLIGASLLLGIISWLVIRRTARDPHWLAQRIEAANPDLGALLLTALDQTSPSGGRLGFLQESVIDSAVAHARTHRWTDTVSPRQMSQARLLHALSLASLCFVIMFLINCSPGFGPKDYSGARIAFAAGEGIRVEVQPGHVSLEKSTPLLVTAKFPGSVPVEANLILDAAAPIASRPMTRNLDDPTFAGHLAAVDADLTYRVEFPGGTSENYRVKVYEHPELKRVNATLVYPSFAKLEPKTLEDVRHVTVVEGTEVTLFCEFNKPVAKAVLTDEANASIPLIRHDEAKPIYKVALTPVKSQRYRLQLTDPDGRANKQPASIAIHLTKNLPPVVAVKSPGRDSRVSPIEEVNLLAEMKDDFGLVRYGINVTMPDQKTTDLVLGESAPEAGLKKVQSPHQIDLEAMKAQPDQVVSYYFWAEDLGPDGKPRRTSGDLYFAEVRHFEEIFRQGEPPPSGEGEPPPGQEGNAEKAEQLAEMQKQIIAGLWKLIRRETGAAPTERFAEDIATLKEAQAAVLEKSTELLEKLKAPASIDFLKKAMTFMTEAEARISDATVPALPPALTSAQAAYQALLKLRAREFEVQKGSKSRQSARAGSQSRSPSQQQLKQLDLAEEEERYETQKQAKLQQENQAQRDREQRELQDLANKLRDLARRQTDLTDRVKELQAALEQAKDEQKKAELDRQLKRLQEQQQQVLRDTDELQEKMESEGNRPEAKQQTEQSREAVRHASEALEKGQLQKAINEGTRAGRQMEDLRDKLRKEAAGRFGEEVRDLRKQARELDENQQKLTKDLEEMNKSQRPALREPSGKEQVQKGLDQQRKEFDKIQERMEKTVREAEETEPALAQALFNTARQAAEQKTGEAIDAAKQLAQAGAAPDAAEASRQAAKGTEQLRKGIEKAAENVLGGQTEALKRAQRELEDLGNQLDKEIAQATGKDPSKAPASGGRKSPEGDGKEKGPQGKANGKEGKGGGKEPGKDGKGGSQPGKEGKGQPGGEGSGPPSLDDLPEKPDLRKLGGPPKKGQPNGSERSGSQTAGATNGPIRETGFREWFDRMRATEELIEDPKLRAEAAQIRDKVRATREEFKRHSKEPNWDLLRDQASKPLAELRERIASEIRRRESPDALVPIDRDPVPPEFVDGVRKYYERLGSEK